MKIAVCALTKNGAALARKAGAVLGADVYLKRSVWTEGGGTPFDKPLKELIKEIYGSYDGFVMIMASGIAVRTFAPLLESKAKDPAVVVMDEQGRFAVSLLSGHLGGANALAAGIADLLGATAVITTATDVNEKTAFDLFAKENDCAIENLEALKYLNGALVNGGEVEIYSDFPICGEYPEGVKAYKGGTPPYLVVISDRKETPQGQRTLWLRPRCLYLGCGCKKQTDPAKFAAAADDFMTKSGHSALALKALCSIELKKEEPCLLAYANRRGLGFETYGADALAGVDVASGSAFVESVTGVKSVAEAAAKLAGGVTLTGKTVYDGITLSLAKREVSLTWKNTEKSHE